MEFDVIEENLYRESSCIGKKTTVFSLCRVIQTCRRDTVRQEYEPVVSVGIIVRVS